MKMVKAVSFLLFTIILMASCSIFDQYYDECKKIAQAMTEDQKIGQTIQLTFEGITEK